MFTYNKLLFSKIFFMNPVKANAYMIEINHVWIWIMNTEFFVVVLGGVRRR